MQPARQDAPSPPSLRRRMRGKQPPWATWEDPQAALEVYLVTLSAVIGDTIRGASIALRAVSSMPREQVRGAILDAVANPLHDRGGRPRSQRLEAVKL